MKKISLTLLLVLACSYGFAQMFRIDSLPPQGILLDKGWKFYAGDSPNFAKPDFDDSKWDSIDPTKDIFDLPQLDKNGSIFWLRIRLAIDTTITRQLVLQLNQSGASEIYLNGKLLHTFGTVSKNPSEIIAFTPNIKPFSFPTTNEKEQVLAFRYAFQPNISYGRHFGQSNKVIDATINSVDYGSDAFENRIISSRDNNLYVASFGILFLLFITFFLFFPNRKESLYFAIYAFLLTFTWTFFFKVHQPIAVKDIFLWFNSFLIAQSIGYVFSLASVYELLGQKRGWQFLLLALVGIIACFTGTYIYDWGWMVFGFITINLINIDIVRLSVIAVNKHKKGAWIMVVGGLVYLFCWAIFSLDFSGIFSLNSHLPFNISFFLISILSVPVSFAVYFGYDFGLTNHALEQKLIENEQLAEQKQQILTTQNETLEKQVTERTAELQHKNRDLEIEAALERVRSRSLAMYHSDEIQEVAYTLYNELKSLNFQFGACSVYLIDADDNIEAWVAGFDAVEYPLKLYVPKFDHPLYKQQIKAFREGKKFETLYLTPDIKQAYDDQMFLHTDYKKLKPELIRMMRGLQSVVFSMAYNKHGALHWGPGELSEGEKSIFQKFSFVFEQAYTRFLDLQKAEAQAREAQIETALERVRSRTMAMRKSEELKEVISLVLQEIRKLDILAEHAGFYIDYKQHDDMHIWLADPNLEPFFTILPYFDTPTWNNFLEAKAKDTALHTDLLDFEEKNKFYNTLFQLFTVPEEAKQFYMQCKGLAVSTVLLDSVGLYIENFEGIPYNDEDNTVLMRFGKVFQQTYTRFLDLQKAEAQAREAQIEAALERIRSRVMAMDTSDELNTLIGFIYTECTKLNMLLDRGFIMTFDKVTKDAYWWMVSADAPDMPLKILVKYHEYAPNLAILKGWEEQEQRWSYVLEGDNKKTWDDYQFANDLSQLPDFVKDNMRSVKSVILNASFQNFGCIMLSSFEPLSEDHFNLLIRLSKVFELTYTRFLDLQLKEQNAIKILEEKQKLERTLTELRSTQAQLIQKEKLASLGELTAGIAHEIQNPLNFVNNFSEMSVDLAKELKEEVEKPEIDKGLIIDLAVDLSQNQEKINHHGKRASSIVKGMLEHSRASTGVKELTDINKLADEYLRLSYHGLRAKDSTFNADYELIADDNLPSINLVPQDIGRVLLNLINNAFWAVRGVKNPKVIVSILNDDAHTVVIKISDNGTGISESIKSKIFQPFFTTKPTGEGTGLGLSLSYDIVTKGHGGTLEVESVEGEGATFVIKLPI